VTDNLHDDKDKVEKRDNSNINKGILSNEKEKPTE
jgi:hypothetical protein